FYGRKLPLSRGLRRVLGALLLMVALQVASGILTLVNVVPIPLALVHQAGSLAVFALALLALHAALGLGTRPEGMREAPKGVMGE
ncbi:MAG: COX15/CtaA family protein, partial [Alphaproteobacteria bacterium]